MSIEGTVVPLDGIAERILSPPAEGAPVTETNFQKSYRPSQRRCRHCTLCRGSVKVIREIAMVGL